MRRTLALLFAAVAAAPVPAPASVAVVVRNAGVEARLEPSALTIANGPVTRTWDGSTGHGPRTMSIADERTGLRLDRAQADFSLVLDGTRVPSDLMQATAAPVIEPIDGGVRIAWRGLVAPGAIVDRVVEAYGGIAGFRSETTLTAQLAPLSGYTFDEIAVGAEATPTLHSFRSGSDWRYDDGWQPFSIGDPRKGPWHVATPGARGRAVTGPGEYLSVALPGGAQVGLVAGRRDYASSILSYDAAIATAAVDLSRDVVYFGPIEESVHVENPGPGPARHGGIARALDLEPSWTVFGAGADDEVWQFSKLLRRERPGLVDRRVIFNTDKVDSNKLSTGAKDDVDFARFRTLAAAAREMGVDTFVFDDGWQARSGDWCPDSAACPEPRARFAATPRFPDDTFAAARAELANHNDDPADDIQLGLWFTPMEFHPSSKAYQTNPQWACAPVGHGTAGLSIVDPNSGSNDAGIGVWNPLALGVDPDDPTKRLRLIDYIEGRLRRAIEVYGARYFKFDFLVWVDCGGVEPVDMYGYHDAFVAMVDELITDYPDVTFTIDETNDYRMFPYESVARGSTWFQNGRPGMAQLLHNVWNLAPYVPGAALGQPALANDGEIASIGVDALMAAALGSHITFWNEIDTKLSTAQRAQVKRWTSFYRANRDLFGGFTFPLLGDPLAKGWTALQPWDADAERGWLLAYRQSSADASRRIPLRGLPADGSFRLTLVDPADGAQLDLGTHTAASLRTDGVPVTIARANGYAIVRIDRA